MNNPCITHKKTITTVHAKQKHVITRKRFSEKPIVAVTNITVFIDLYITKPVWSHVLALSARTLKKDHIVSCQEASAQITNICMKVKFLSN